MADFVIPSVGITTGLKIYLEQNEQRTESLSKMNQTPKMSIGSQILLQNPLQKIMSASLKQWWASNGIKTMAIGSNTGTGTGGSKNSTTGLEDMWEMVTSPINNFNIKELFKAGDEALNLAASNFSEDIKKFVKDASSFTKDIVKDVVKDVAVELIVGSIKKNNSDNSNESNCCCGSLLKGTQYEPFNQPASGNRPSKDSNNPNKDGNLTKNSRNSRNPITRFPIFTQKVFDLLKYPIKGNPTSSPIKGTTSGFLNTGMAIGEIRGISSIDPNSSFAQFEKSRNSDAVPTGAGKGEINRISNFAHQSDFPELGKSGIKRLARGFRPAGAIMDIVSIASAESDEERNKAIGGAAGGWGGALAGAATGAAIGSIIPGVGTVIGGALGGFVGGVGGGALGEGAAGWFSKTFGKKESQAPLTSPAAPELQETFMDKFTGWFGKKFGNKESQVPLTPPVPALPEPTQDFNLDVLPADALGEPRELTIQVLGDTHVQINEIAELDDEATIRRLGELFAQNIKKSLENKGVYGV